MIIPAAMNSGVIVLGDIMQAQKLVFRSLALGMLTLMDTAFGAPVTGTEWNATLQLDVTYKRNCPSLKSLRQHSLTQPGALTLGVDGSYSLIFRDGRVFSAGTYAQTGDSLSFNPREEFLSRKNAAYYLPAGLFRQPVLRRMTGGKRRVMPMQSRFTGVTQSPSPTRQTLMLEESRTYRFTNPDGNGQTCGNRLEMVAKVRGASKAPNGKP